MATKKQANKKGTSKGKPVNKAAKSAQKQTAKKLPSVRTYTVQTVDALSQITLESSGTRLYLKLAGVQKGSVILNATSGNTCINLYVTPNNSQWDVHYEFSTSSHTTASPTKNSAQRLIGGSLAELYLQGDTHGGVPIIKAFDDFREGGTIYRHKYNINGVSNSISVKFMSQTISGSTRKAAAIKVPFPKDPTLELDCDNLDNTNPDEQSFCKCQTC